MAHGFAGGHPWRRKVTEITLPVRLILNEPSRCCQELAFTEHQRCARVGGAVDSSSYYENDGDQAGESRDRCPAVVAVGGLYLRVWLRGVGEGLQDDLVAE